VPRKKTVKIATTSTAPNAVRAVADSGEADRAKFMRQVSAFMQSAPDDIRDYLHFLYVVTREFDFAVGNGLALIPFNCDDGVTRWAVFKSSSVAKVTPAEKRRVTIAAKKRGVTAKPSAMLAMDLSPISMGLARDPIEAIRQAKMFIADGPEEAN